MVGDKTALVLGGSGFLGSHVADALVEHGFQITVFDQKTSPYLKSPHRQIIGNILDLDLVEAEVAKHNYILNFAGVADLKEAKLDPQRASQINIMGNLNV